jgi:hypothetical protein
MVDRWDGQIWMWWVGEKQKHTAKQMQSPGRRVCHKNVISFHGMAWHSTAWQGRARFHEWLCSRTWPTIHCLRLWLRLDRAIGGGGAAARKKHRLPSSRVLLVGPGCRVWGFRGLDGAVLWFRQYQGNILQPDSLDLQYCTVLCFRTYCAGTGTGSVLWKLRYGVDPPASFRQPSLEHVLMGDC